GIGISIIEGYGLTEATVLVSGNPVDGVKKIGSIGIRFPYSEIKIVKTEGGQLLECDPNEIGEICVASPGVWAGNTYTEAEKNKDLYFDGRFLRTGDRNIGQAFPKRCACLGSSHTRGGVNIGCERLNRVPL
ncbi:MAG: hypothetical protein EBZ27_09865, partial [Rhodobacteraceae bacterium]|nr:hypothetical protein [Paracoccaceae bacterium]